MAYYTCSVSILFIIQPTFWPTVAVHIQEILHHMTSLFVSVLCHPNIVTYIPFLQKNFIHFFTYSTWTVCNNFEPASCQLLTTKTCFSWNTHQTHYKLQKTPRDSVQRIFFITTAIAVICIHMQHMLCRPSAQAQSCQQIDSRICKIYQSISPNCRTFLAT